MPKFMSALFVFQNRSIKSQVRICRCNSSSKASTAYSMFYSNTSTSNSSDTVVFSRKCVQCPVNFLEVS
ncbi:hypothetical protein M3J09_010253 [Ascochyta lentis]